MVYLRKKKLLKYFIKHYSTINALQNIEPTHEKIINELFDTTKIHIDKLSLSIETPHDRLRLILMQTSMDFLKNILSWSIYKGYISKVLVCLILKEGSNLGKEHNNLATPYITRIQRRFISRARYKYTEFFTKKQKIEYALFSDKSDCLYFLYVTPDVNKDKENIKFVANLLKEIKMFEDQWIQLNEEHRKITYNALLKSMAESRRKSQYICWIELAKILEKCQIDYEPSDEDDFEEEIIEENSEDEDSNTKSPDYDSDDDY